MKIAKRPNIALFNRSLRAGAAALFICLPIAPPAFSQTTAMANLPSQTGPTYADLVTLAERSEVVIKAKIRRQAQLKAERAPGLQPGFARLYLEAETLALIAGDRPVREDLAYLVDVPLDGDGDAPKLKKREVLLFARVTASQRGEPTQLQLAGKSAQLAATGPLEADVRTVLSSLAGPAVPPVVTGIRDALAVKGTLAGESETQIFLTSATGSPVSISVLRRPGLAPVWGVSWGEIIDAAARPPERGTLRWYRLACALPPELPSSANLARDPAERRLASEDYAFVIREIGECNRAITTPVS